jgi:hypothetical protein
LSEEIFKIMNNSAHWLKLISNWFTELRNGFEWQFWYILFSFIVGTYFFFLNPALVESFSEQSLIFYFKFSQEIYSPQTNFYAESVLFAWLSFLFGASKHWLFYKIFSSFLTLLILPTIAYFASKYFDNIWRSWVFILLFVITYRYLWRTYYIGFPDAITIICLAAIALQRRPVIAFLLAVLATVSHFSMALISIGGLILLIVSTPTMLKKLRLSFVMHLIAGLVVGRLLLAVWFYRFKYSLQTRFDWAIDFGLTGFISRYQENISGFWLTPGISFLIVFGIICIWMFYKRSFMFVFVMVFCLALAYFSLFVTVDGLRVFAVVISAPYIFMLRAAVEACGHELKLQEKNQ